MCRFCSSFQSALERRHCSGWPKAWQAAQAPRTASLGMDVSSWIRCSAMYITGFASSGAKPCSDARYLMTERASPGEICRPFWRTMRLIAWDQPSGVVRIQEIRERLPLESLCGSCHIWRSSGRR